MPPRIQPPSRAANFILHPKGNTSRHPRYYATASAAIASSPSHPVLPISPPPTRTYPKTQPPSRKPAEFRKSQLLRQYASLLRSAPLILLFQHNNLKANEWSGIRRELNAALAKVDAAEVAAGKAPLNLAQGVKIQIIETGLFGAALKVVEYYHPEPQLQPGTANLTHVLSQAAHDAVANIKMKHELAPLLAGPLALLTFPTVSPIHMKAALSILSPSAPLFPAPTRRASPGWHDAGVQSGIQKLMLLGARVEGKVFDAEGTKWVGSIEGGLDGLRGQLVAMLQSLGAGVTNTLESAAKNLYYTVESRRTMMEDEEKGPEVVKKSE